MLTPPDGLTEPELRTVISGRWNVTVGSIGYRPVGFGSHHWAVLDDAGGRWFVTADELTKRRRTSREPLDLTLGRLRAALSAACDLHDCGRRFVVAPVRAGDEEPLVRTGEFTIALYPFVDGESFEFGDFPTPQHRRGVLERVVAVHTAPAAARRRAMADDFVIPLRDELVEIVSSGGVAGATGPYARPAARLVARHAGPIRRLLARYDGLAASAGADLSRWVLTHGEPHPGNTMLTSDGWLLIDWDTALVAPPERDLWSLDPGDGSVLQTYADATGTTPEPSLLELYRIRWDLADLAVYVSRFRRKHTGTADDAKSWEAVRSLVEQIAPGPGDARDPR